MGRAAKIVAVAVLSGLLMTLAIMHLGSPPKPGTLAPGFSGAGASADTDILRRCRTATAPDPICAAAWDEKRRRFFRQEKERR